MFPRLIIVLALMLFPLMSATLPVSAGENRIEIPVTISKLPRDAWAKSRIFSSFEDGALVLRDEGRGPFDDASMWEIPIDQTLPYGPKTLSFDLVLGEQHKALWNNKLIQPIINGVEAEPALDKNGTKSFRKIVSTGDGNGFIPAKSQTILLQMDASDLSLNSIAFMTAGAENFEIKISNIKVVMLPQSDGENWSLQPHVSTLGYREGSAKTAYVEWMGSGASAPNAVAILSLSNKTDGREEEIAVPIPSQMATISGSRVSAVELSHLAAGQYAITAPGSRGDNKERTLSFEVVSGDTHIKTLRDDAWGAFYWITNGPYGPYPKAHQQDLGAIDFDVPTDTKDVSGGWFDAGDYGKYAVNGAYSVSLMLITGLIAADTLSHDINKVANANANVADWLRVADSQLNWLYKMQRADGAVYHKATSRKWPSLSASPEDDRAIKWLMPVTTTATANFASAMSLGAKIYLAQDDDAYRSRGAEFQIAAERALEWLDKNNDIKMTEFSYDGNDYGGAYHDDDDSDERFFAHASYAALTEDKSALSIAMTDLMKLQDKMAAREYDVNWRTVDLLGVWALATSEKLDGTSKETVMGILRKASTNWRDIQAQSSWGIAVADDDELYWGSNSVFATIGWHWVLWSHLSGDETFVEYAETQLQYLFGLNPLNKTYITGPLSNSVKAPHFRPSTSGRIKLPAGFISGGPNSSGLDGDAPPMHSYVDDIESFTTNEFAINWQSAWALYTSLLAAKVN